MPLAASAFLNQRVNLTSNVLEGKMVSYPPPADVAELADALDSGSSSVTRVKVQVLSSAPIKSIVYGEFRQRVTFDLPTG